MTTVLDRRPIIQEGCHRVFHPRLPPRPPSAKWRGESYVKVHVSKSLRAAVLKLTFGKTLHLHVFLAISAL
jgi:hypothetical protein